MNRRLLTAVAAATFALLANAASAQATAASAVQRNVNQQTRIEQGLQSGALSTKEAARLEKEQATVSHVEARSAKDGTITPTEQARINALQNKTSADIADAKHNGVTGNPTSPSSERMQADVQRDVNQQKRTQAGAADGSLTTHEVAKVERGQAKSERQQARAGRDGKVTAREQAHVQRTENVQSKKIHRQRHDAQVRQPA
jgi:hypothetical protein